MTTIRTFSGVLRYYIDGERIKDCRNLLTVALIRHTDLGLTFCEFNLKKHFYYENHMVKNLPGQVMYLFDGHMFQDFYHRFMYRFENDYVKTFNFVMLYKIDGPISVGELALLITAFEEGLLEFPK